MFSNSDFEKLWFLYKTEGEPKGISINSFCVNQGVPYNQFNDWFRKTHKKIVDGIPSVDESPVKESTSKVVKEKGDILILIQNREGLQIKKKKLKLPGVEAVGRETGGLMLTISK